MSRAAQTLKPAYFEAIYARDSDPWKFASSDYESEKYAITLAALPQSRYVSAFEIGCSIGVLTRQLAPRCDRLLAVDAARAPLAVARRHCAQFPSVRFEQMFVPAQWPDGVFDLILLSEIIYYLNVDDVARLGSRISHALAPQGNIVLVHWTGETDYPLTGDEAAERFILCMDGVAQVIRRDRHRDFRLDVLERR